MKRRACKCLWYWVPVGAIGGLLAPRAVALAQDAGAAPVSLYETDDGIVVLSNRKQQATAFRAQRRDFTVSPSKPFLAKPEKSKQTLQPPTPPKRRRRRHGMSFAWRMALGVFALGVTSWLGVDAMAHRRRG